MVRRQYAILVIVLCGCICRPLFADPDNQKIPQWSDLIELKNTSSFSYQETRYLQLLDEPWRGGGLLLASKDGTLVKLQMRPHRKIMAITPGEMIYFDDESNERHRIPLSASNPMTRQALIFQELMQGNLEKIGIDYDVDFNKTASSWILTLKPKPENRASIYSEIRMSGSGNDTTRNIRLNERGGDSSLLSMHLLETGHQLEFMIERLLREAIGQ